eukprot:SAG31_NODE_87_length_26728_cov_40.161591_8_plen_249_part_00
MIIFVIIIEREIIMISSIKDGVYVAAIFIREEEVTKNSRRARTGEPRNRTGGRGRGACLGPSAAGGLAFTPPPPPPATHSETHTIPPTLAQACAREPLALAAAAEVGAGARPHRSPAPRRSPASVRSWAVLGGGGGGGGGGISTRAMDDDFNFFLPDTLLEDSDSDGEVRVGVSPDSCAPRADRASVAHQGGGARGPADGWAKSKLAQNFAPAPAAAASTLDGLGAGCYFLVFVGLSRFCGSNREIRD